MDYIKKHKKEVTIIAVALVVLILLGMLIHSVMPNSKKNAWGNRTSDIASHPINDEEVKKVRDEIMDSGKVESVDYRLSIRTMNFTIKLKSDVKRSDAEKLGEIVLKNLSDDTKGYYDIQLLYDVVDGDSFMGYKNKISSEFKFTYAGE